MAQQIYLDVEESLLRWALGRSNKSVDTLSKKQGLENLSKWLNGTKKPSLSQLEKFAKATYTPFGYLLLSSPPKEQLSITHFRTLTNTNPAKPSPDLIDTIRTIERRQDWIREYLIDIGTEPLEFVNSVLQTDPPEYTAGKIRERLDITDSWTTEYRNWECTQAELYKKIEAAGIFVTINGIVGNNTHRKLKPSEFRGFVLVDNYAPFLFVNNVDSKGAQMFTIAHELAHVWLGSSAVFDLHRLRSAENNIEMLCNKIAAELLVPTKEMERNWDKFVNAPDPYKEASLHFKVSRIVAARRALDTNRIDQKTFDEFYNEYERQEQSKQQADKSSGDFYKTTNLRIGKKFAGSVITAVEEGKILYREAYRLTGLKSESFSEMKKRLYSEG